MIYTATLPPGAALPVPQLCASGVELGATTTTTTGRELPDTATPTRIRWATGTGPVYTDGRFWANHSHVAVIVTIGRCG